MGLELSEIREKIDSIDEKLLELFCERMDCAKMVAEYKKGTNTPVLNLKREQEILDKVSKNSGEYSSYSRLLFSSIMELSRSLQHNILSSGKELRNLITNAGSSFDTKSVKIGCPGIKGSNTHMAQLKLCGNVENVSFYTTFREVFEAVNNGEIDMGIVPVENSSVGSVSDVYDLILKYRFHIVAAVDMNIDNSLCGVKGADLNKIEKVISHPQALAQCSNYIADNKLSKIECENTAIGAKLVADQNNMTVAAVCNKCAAKEYGLEVLEEDIQNLSGNKTRFILISKQLLIPDDADKISVCFAVANPDTPGSLNNILLRFNAVGLSLTKIESRPIDSNFHYLFYIDFSGNVKNSDALNLVCALYDELPQFDFLGNYKEI